MVENVLEKIYYNGIKENAGRHNGTKWNGNAFSGRDVDQMEHLQEICQHWNIMECKMNEDVDQKRKIIPFVNIFRAERR